MEALRIVVMGTPAFALPTFDALSAAGHRIVCAYCQPPRPAGRGQKPRPTPVEARATACGVMVRTPTSLKPEAEHAAFAALAADVAVVVAYGLILPEALLVAPRLGCVNLHASLLPRWRGAAPIQRAILAGDKETGVTAMVIDTGLDTGPVLLQARQRIAADATAASLHDELARLGAPLMVQAVAGLSAGTLKARPQSAAGVTYADKIDKREGRIDWRRPAVELERLVRGLNPSPGAWFTVDGKRIKLHAARLVAAEGMPGTVLDDRLTVACGAGALGLVKLQRPGRAAMGADQFLRGYHLPRGSVLA